MACFWYEKAYILNPSFMHITLRNFLTTLKRFKTASALNVLGLGVAFAAFLIVVIYVRFEYSFDAQHPDKEHIYVLENMRDHGHWDGTFSRPHIEKLMASSPHIVAAGAYTATAYSSSTIGISIHEDPAQPGHVEKLERITPGFAEVFHFDMIEGDTKSLAEPNKILISESQARKFFGNEAAVGKPIYLSEARELGQSIRINDSEISTTQAVGGVYRDFPENSRLRNVLYFPIPEPERMSEWHQGGYYGFVKLDSVGSPTRIGEDFKSENAELLKNLAVENIRLRPLTELYFATSEGAARTDGMPTGNKLVTDLLMLVGLLLIVIAAINFVNFSIALTPMRIRNINTQKVLGHTVPALRRDLVAESVLITLVAFGIGLGLVALLDYNEALNGLLGFTFSISANLPWVALTGVLAVLTGLIAGLYPAWHMTSFQPAMVLNGSYAANNRVKSVRKLLIGFQYVASIVLIVCALFIYIQTQYIGRVDLGFERSNLVQVKLPTALSVNQPELYRQKLLEHPQIVDVAFTEFQFVRDEPRPYIGFNYEGEHYYQNWIGVSPNFPELLEVELIEGRLFREEDRTDRGKKAACIISQTCAEMLKAQLGTGFKDWDNDNEVEIVGIFKDVHFESLYRAMAPMGLWVSSPDRQAYPHVYSYVKIAGGNAKGALEHIRKTVHELDPSYPPQIEFFDQTLNNLYAHSYRQGMLVTGFSLIAIVLSIIGVFGLVVFETQGRRKEIAIRKVLGSTVREILVLLNQGFVWITVICFVIAAPLAWYGVTMWLDNFAYKTPLHLWVFGLAFGLVLTLTILTVTLQSYRAATENPVKAIKAG